MFTNSMTTSNKTVIQARIDIRGFIRVQKTILKELALEDMDFADIYIDSLGKRIGIVPSLHLKESSFRIIKSPASVIIYLKGAMNSIGLKAEPGAYVLEEEDGKFVFYGKEKPEKTGPFALFACRNSAGITMISIDTRGTLILDKRTCQQLNTKENATFTAEYSKNTRSFTLTFGKEGFSNVRTIASHAKASFMGTLTSNGIAIPKKRLRTSCNVYKNTLTFSVDALMTKETKEAL